MGTRRAIDRHSLLDFARRQLERAANVSRSNLAKREFRLPFLRINAWFSDPTFAETCDAALAVCHTNECRLQPADADRQVMEIVVLDADESAECWMSDREFERTLAESGLRGSYIHDYRFWQLFDVASGFGVQISDGRFGNPPWEPGSPLRVFLHWAFDEMKMRLTHAATLGNNGSGFLIAGRGGSGKSGTTLAGILYGLSSVGDDYVLVKRDSVPRAHAIFSQMKQDPAGLLRNRVEVASIEGKPNWQGKLVFDPRSIRADSLAEELALIGVLLPRIAHQRRTTLRPANPVEAMLSLAPSGVLQLPCSAESGMRFFSQLVRVLPAWHLDLSEEGPEIADTIHGFLERKEVALAG